MSNTFDSLDFIDDYVEPTEEEIKERELKRLNDLYTKDCHYIKLTEEEREEYERLLDKYSVDE